MSFKEGNRLIGSLFDARQIKQSKIDVDSLSQVSGQAEYLIIFERDNCKTSGRKGFATRIDPEI